MPKDLLKDVVEARHLGGHRLWLRFEDGVEGPVDLRDVISDFRGVLAALRDPAFVARVRVHPEFGTVTWPGDLDLDPVVLYCAVLGIPVPTYEVKPKRNGKASPPSARRRRSGARPAEARRRRTGA